VGSCAFERKYSDRQSSWWPAYHGEGENMADDLRWFVGVDWASETHQAALLDAHGTVMGNGFPMAVLGLAPFVIGCWRRPGP
jgi:hypothetical protein